MDRAISESLEAWIQQALNQHIANGKTSADFSEILRRHIYSDVLQAAAAVGIEHEIKEALDSPQRVSKTKFPAVIDFIETHFRDSTIFAIADELASAPADRMPNAVLNFNADTFFPFLVSILKKRTHLKDTGRWEDPPSGFMRVVRSSTEISKIPIYHLHGCVLPLTPSGPSMRESPENMIFPEDSYTDIAGRMFSWAQTTFLYYAQVDSLLFVGMSMADSNVSRWLAWAFQGYCAAVQSVASRAEISGRHVWVSTGPGSASSPKASLYPYALRHLGVQVCWIPNWLEFRPAFRNLIGVS